jgi:23S rRNA pseudouridine1911/1915/1917 synthase
MAQRVQLTATVTENQLGQRLDQALAELFPDYSRSRIKEWILDQRVLVNGTIGDKPKEKVLGRSIAIDVKSKKRRASSRRIFRSISFTKMMTSS